MNDKISFTKQQLLEFINDYTVHIYEDIREYGFPELFSNHPVHYIDDFVDSYFENRLKYINKMQS